MRSVLSALVAAGLVTLPATSEAQSPQTTHLLEVWIDAGVTGDSRPFVSGITNLPDGTLLQVRILKTWLPDAVQWRAAGLSMCSDVCGFLVNLEAEPDSSLEPNTTVANGAFKAGPFAEYNSRKEFRDPTPGLYIVSVQALRPKHQSPEVRAVIGDRGQNMTGPLIGLLCVDAGGIRDKDHLKKDEIDGDCESLERLFNATEGLRTNYARYVRIGRRY